MNKTLIVSDLDGVVLNFSQAFHDFCWKHYKVYISTDPMRFDYGLEKPLLIEMITSFFKSEDFKYIPCYSEIMLALCFTRHDLVFATDVPEYAQKSRRYNINEYFDPSKNVVYFGPDKNITINKYINDYDRVIFIDDKVENVIAAVELKNPKLEVIYPIRGYNYEQLRYVNAKGYKTAEEFRNLIK